MKNQIKNLTLSAMFTAIGIVPPLFLNATAMVFELLTYGLVVGLLYSRSRWQCIIVLYSSIIAAMVALNRTGLVRFRKAQPVPQLEGKS